MWSWLRAGTLLALALCLWLGHQLVVRAQVLPASGQIDVLGVYIRPTPGGFHVHIGRTTIGPLWPAYRKSLQDWPLLEFQLEVPAQGEPDEAPVGP